MDDAAKARWEATARSMVKAVKLTIGGVCPQCGGTDATCRGAQWCPKWKKLRPCDIVSDEYWDLLCTWDEENATKGS